MSAILNFRMLRSVLTGVLITLSTAAMAEVYTYTDAQGNRVFTDQPHKNAKRVEILPSNSTSGNPPPQRTVKSAPAKPKAKALFRYNMLRVLVPDPDATVRSTEGELIVTVTSEPALQDGHSYRLSIDGKPSEQTGRSPVFPLKNVDRGTHQLAAEILDETGRVLEKSPSQTFHMLRISLAQKRMARPCKTPEYGVRPECPLKNKPEEENSILPFF